MRVLITLIFVLSHSIVGANEITYPDEGSEVIISRVNSLHGENQKCVANFVSDHQSARKSQCLKQASKVEDCDMYRELSGINISVFVAALDKCLVNITKTIKRPI